MISHFPIAAVRIVRTLPLVLGSADWADETGEGLNHGKPCTFVHQGQEIILCCEDLLAAYKNDPTKYLSKLTSK